jgi:O-6-methylguanine DNA methyltransferase
VTKELEALESVEVRAQFTTYAVPGWGVGELWTGEGLVLAHEFRYGAVLAGAKQPAATSRELRAAPPKGSRGPLSSTVPRTSERVGNGIVSTSQLLSPSSARSETPGAQSSLSSAALDPAALAERFAAFFAGDEADFLDVPIDLEWATPFQRAVAEALRAVPRGTVVSYGELAALAGYPGAARAAGSFCAHNRFMLIVPCHRVVGASGLGGYGSAGLETKRRLLALEGVEL